MLSGQVASTCVNDISQHRAVGADNPSDNEIAITDLLDRWTDDVRPTLEHACASIEVIDQNDEAGFTFEGILRIDCHVKGTLPRGSGTLIVGSRGHCETDAQVGTARIEGTVRGNISASQLIELNRGAIVRGHLEAPAISIGDGAIFEGDCRLTVPSEEPSPISAHDNQTNSMPPAYASDDEVLVAAAAS